jgi:hypothetical protein
MFGFLYFCEIFNSDIVLRVQLIFFKEDLCSYQNSSFVKVTEIPMSYNALATKFAAAREVVGRRSEDF